MAPAPHQPQSVRRAPGDEVEDALLPISYEESHGHVAVLLEDIDFGLWVVLSSRRFRGRRRG